MEGRRVTEESALLDEVGEGGDEDLEFLAAKYSLRPYSGVVALAMVLNYVIGTGCFGLPFAVTEGGVVASILLLTFGTVVALISMNYTLESMARADGVSAAAAGFPLRNGLSYEKFDFSRIAQIFTGGTGRTLTQISIIMYSAGTLWSYASVFSSSAALLLSRYLYSTNCNVYAADASSACTSLYYVSMLLFSAIVGTLAMMNLSQQASIQKFLSAYRVVVLSLMILTLAWYLRHAEAATKTVATHVVTDRLNRIGSVRWHKFGKIFGPCFLAISCQFNMPDALQPLHPKRNARTVAMTAMILSSALYLLLGVMGALSFDDVNPLVSLNWSTYTACGHGWETCAASTTAATGIIRTVTAFVVQLLVLCFPMVSVMSSYPMLGVTMGDNIAVSIPDAVRSQLGEKKAILGARMACVIPPLVLAALFKKLDMILSVAGVFGFLLNVGLPCIFYLQSQRYIDAKFGPQSIRTPFSVIFPGHRVVAVFLLFASVIFAIIALVTIFIH